MVSESFWKKKLQKYHSKVFCFNLWNPEKKFTPNNLPVWVPLFGINVDTEKGTYSSYHYQSAALAGGAYDWASPHAGFCWAPEETPRVRTSPRAKTHQRWNYWVQGRYMISQNKRTKRTPKNTSSEKESKPSSHFQWKDVKNFPTVFLSFALGDVNSMYILRGTLIYVQSVHIYIYISPMLPYLDPSYRTWYCEYTCTYRYESLWYIHIIWLICT